MTVSSDLDRRFRDAASTLGLVDLGFDLVETGAEDSRPAYAELADLTDGLGTKERAAVVLRYGYDLSYEQIASALDSTPGAARQAASTGVRRIRRRIAP